MKNFQFENICLLSNKEKKGRMITFHPKKNLIVGGNHTGKSTIIKTLFLTMGARPFGKLLKWDQDAISLVTFIINEVKYQVIHQNGVRALYDGNGSVLFATSAHKDWAIALSSITGFNLILTDKESQSILADARAFFLPFYINQDGSWQSKWDTFGGIQQYKAPILPILEYFSGIKPPEYYFLNSSKQIEEKKLSDCLKEWSFLVKAKQRLSKSISLNAVKTQPENFTLEIEQLTVEVTNLNNKQEKLRDKAVREGELIENIHLQIKLAQEALHTYNADKNYIQEEVHDPLVCPVCHAEHTDSFIPLLTYAEDARVLNELVIKLQSDSLKAKEIYEKTMDELAELDANYKRISQILEARKGDLIFGDIVKSMGAEAAFEAFVKEEDGLTREINESRNKISELDTELDRLSDPKRSKEILKAFRDAYTVALQKLNLPAMETKRLRLNSRPDMSGSGGPRSILAYYGALWSVCLSDYSSFRIPIVIDSPNQQGQDNINLPKVLNYVATGLPSNSQVIMGTENETSELFDKRIELNEQYSVLQNEEYDDLQKAIGPLLKSMYAKLDQQNRENEANAN